jgi:hypothetical protein
VVEKRTKGAMLAIKDNASCGRATFLNHTKLAAEAVEKLALFVADQAMTKKRQLKQLVSVGWRSMETACLDHVWRSIVRVYQ